MTRFLPMEIIVIVEIRDLYVKKLDLPYKNYNKK